MLLLPLLGWTQFDMSGDQLKFYTELGERDAKHELSLFHLSDEDEHDFWLDQKAFETLLKEKNPAGHQSYLNGKHRVYRQHQIHCGERCGHSEQFSQQIAFYIINGQTSVNEGVVFTKGQNNGTPKQ